VLICNPHQPRTQHINDAAVTHIFLGNIILEMSPILVGMREVAQTWSKWWIRLLVRAHAILQLEVCIQRNE
jgi:hypothetical protein